VPFSRGRQLGLLERGHPAGQQGERVGAGATGLSGVYEHRQTGVGGQLEGVVHQLQAPDDGVVDEFGPGAVQVDVVRRPPGAEVLAGPANWRLRWSARRRTRLRRWPLPLRPQARTNRRRTYKPDHLEPCRL